MNGYKDIKITAQEMEKLSESLKNEEFKALFLDYVKEISDPENRKLYEEELKALEAEQGNDLTFINPDPQFCVKTVDGDGKKTFVNICSSDVIKEAVAKKSGKGSQWSIPYSLGVPRDDFDSAKKECKVYDVVFHSETIKKCMKDARFKDLIISTACEGIEKQFKLKLDKNYKLPKLKVKGVIPSTVIRAKKKDYDISASQKVETTSEYLSKVLESQQKMEGISKDVVEMNHKDSKVPEYNIIHQGVISDYTEFTNAREKQGTRPDVLVVKVKLPKVQSISQIELDTFEKCVELKVPAIYEVVIPLPFSVVHEKGTARFDKGTKELLINLPVVKVSMLKPEKVMIEEIQENEIQDDDLEAAKSDGSTPNDLEVSEIDEALTITTPSTKKKEQRIIDPTKVPIFHMRQDEHRVSFMVPLQINKDDAKIIFKKDSLLFTFHSGKEKYSLQVSFDNEIVIEDSILTIQESFGLIILQKEISKDWDLVTVYSSGMKFERFFSKKMSDAEKELWDNPSIVLKPNNFTTVISDGAESEEKHTESTGGPVVGENASIVHVDTSSSMEQNVDDGEKIKSCGDNAQPNAVGSSMEQYVDDGNNTQPNAVKPISVEIIKNSYLFELDD